MEYAQALAPLTSTAQSYGSVAAERYPLGRTYLRMSVPLSLRIAAVLLWVSGFGFGIPCVTAIRSLRAGNGIPRLFGFPAYGEGPFEHHGIATTIPLLLAFLLVCVVEITAGVPLWSGRKVGALLAIGVIPFGAVFWWGFALPIPPLFALARVALIALSWRSLT